MEQKEIELILPLKGKWYDMIYSGVKNEEYREMKPFYISRFSGGLMKDIVDVEADPDTICEVFNRRYSKVSFTRGYPKADDLSRRMRFNSPKLRIGTGNPEWGAEPGRTYFVISWER